MQLQIFCLGNKTRLLQCGNAGGWPQSTAKQFKISIFRSYEHGVQSDIENKVIDHKILYIFIQTLVILHFSY